MSKVVVCLLVVLSLGVACARIDPGSRLGRPPDVSLVDLDLEGGDGQLLRATATVRIDNPNAWRIAVENVTFQIVLNGTLLGRATEGRDLFIGPGDDRELRLELSFSATRTLSALRRRAPARGVGYRVDGEIKLIGRDVDLLPFTLEGRWAPS